MKGDQPSQPLLLEVENLPLPPLFAVELPGVEQREKPPHCLGGLLGLRWEHLALAVLRT